MRLVQSTNAEDFLDALRKHRGFESRALQRGPRWAFRGQWDAKWDLVPSAFRPNQMLGYGKKESPYRVQPDHLDSVSQKDAEHSAIGEFLLLSDSLGLEIPGNDMCFRSNRQFTNVIGHSIPQEGWPPEEIFPLLALAQHHGVPTRLLDFSYNPNVAAFFSALASRSSDRDEWPTELAVWAIDLYFLFSSAEWSDRIKVITVPRYINKYLHAQEGLFLLDGQRKDGDPAALNMIIDDVENETFLGGSLHRIHPLWKFTIPTSEASEILSRLEEDQIDGCHLRPSFDTVVRELERKRDLL